ncbi:MAG: tRNA (adenosine(37)-N6)-threonylcarbamoyltransferase complex dimerization subunit type 1 TsaB [Bdellovibrionia bacterium]
MKLVAWDTSSKTGALVALEWDSSHCKGWQDVNLVAELTLNVDLTHSERLLWGVHQVLELARWKINDVDVFGVGVGPGSFTGLRIGITTARTLAHTLKKPLVRFSSLSALARPMALSHSHLNLKNKTLIVASTDACKGELFALWGTPQAVLKCVVPMDEAFSGNHHLWHEDVQEQVIQPEVLIEKLNENLDRLGKNAQWISVGEGRQRYGEAWENLPADRELKDLNVFPNQIQGRYVGLLAFEAVQAGLLHEGLLVNPRYIRPSDAEIKLKAGLLPSGPHRKT